MSTQYLYRNWTTLVLSTPRVDCARGNIERGESARALYRYTAMRVYNTLDDAGRNQGCRE